MTDRVMQESSPPHRRLRSAVAIVAGFLCVAVLSLVTDQLFHMLGVYPPWDEPMHEVGDNRLALFYRSIYAVIGGYVTVRLAPFSPMRHVLILGCIGTVLSALGAYAAIAMDMGPVWYPIALAVTALPLTLLGGLIARATQRRSDIEGPTR